MKIQSINNTIFQGIYIDKSKDNNGNWRMEYHPYCWEKYNTSKMTEPAEIDIFSNSLPENEKKTTVHHINYNTNEEFSEDILRTRFYYILKDGRMRNLITPAPAMNREESLIIQNKKLKNFLKLKEDYLSNLKNQITDIPQIIQGHKENYDKRSADIKEKYFNRAWRLDASYNEMDKSFNALFDEADQLLKRFKDYIRLKESCDYVQENIKKNENEVLILQKSKADNTLIDISRRDIYDPNKALWDALGNIQEAATKLLALPHKTIQMKELLKISPNTNLRQTIINHVDNLILKHI